MAWWEYIPVVSTIGHAAQTPQGSSVADYAACVLPPGACDGDPAAIFAHELQCDRCVDGLMVQYIAAYTGVGTGPDLFEALVGGGFSAVMALIAKALGKKLLGLSAVGWTGVGAVLVVDGLADAAIQQYKLENIRKAAAQAKQQNCRCR